MIERELLPIPKLEKCRKLLCIQPHPDDIDISSGGTISYLAELGVEIIYLTLTDDTAGFTEKNIPCNKRKKIRKLEQIAAGQILGVREYYWLGFPDAGQWSKYKARKKIIKFIRMLRPDFVMTVDPWLGYEAHQDHIKCGLAASEAVILYNFPYIKTDRVTDGHFTPYEIDGVIFCFSSRPNIVIDTGRHREKKIKAIAQHRSQFNSAGLELLKAYDEMHCNKSAEKYPFDYGEAFKVLHPAMLHFFPEAEKQ